MFGLDPDIFCNIDYRVKHGNDMETKKRDRTLQDGLNKIVFFTPISSTTSSM